jgi:hypothetical protein
MSEASPTEKSRRGWIFLLLRWAAAFAILALLLHFFPAAQLRDALSRVPLTRFLAGAQLSFAASAQCYTSGLFGALFLPSIIGGDVARLAVGISRSPRPAAVITGNVADRFLDVAAQLALVSLGLILLPGSLPVALKAPARHVLFAGAAAEAIFLSLVLILHRPLLGGRSIRFRRGLAQIRHAVRSVSRRPHRLVFGWLLGTSVQACISC